MLNQSPLIINRIEVFDDDLGVLNQISGITITPSGYLGAAIVLVQQLVAPWGWVKYTQRLKDDEQAWLDSGATPDQALIRAYNNDRPKKPAEDKQSEGEDTKEQ